MVDYTLVWPVDFDDYSWELESKGWFAGLEIIVATEVLRPTFYDPVSLAQDVAAEMSSSKVFAESCVVVVDRVTRSSIESAVAELARTGELQRFVR